MEVTLVIFQFLSYKDRKFFANIHRLAVKSGYIQLHILSSNAMKIEINNEYLANIPQCGN